MDAPCRVDSTSAVGRDSSRDIWGTLPLIPEGFQSRLHLGLHPKVCDRLLMLRAVLASVQLKFISQPFQLVGLYFLVGGTEVSYKVFTYLYAGNVLHIAQKYRKL